jgi:hypothetical protein
MYLIRHKPLHHKPHYACNSAFARAFAQQNQLGHEIALYGRLRARKTQNEKLLCRTWRVWKAQHVYTCFRVPQREAKSITLDQFVTQKQGLINAFWISHLSSSTRDARRCNFAEGVKKALSLSVRASGACGCETAPVGRFCSERFDIRVLVTQQ